MCLTPTQPVNNVVVALGLPADRPTNITPRGVVPAAALHRPKTTINLGGRPAGWRFLASTGVGEAGTSCSLSWSPRQTHHAAAHFASRRRRRVFSVDGDRSSGIFPTAAHRWKALLKTQAPAAMPRCAQAFRSVELEHQISGLFCPEGCFTQNNL